MRLTENHSGQADPCAHLVKWMHAYGEEPQLAQMHIYSVIKYMVNKHVLGGANLQMALNVRKTLCRKSNHTEDSMHRSIQEGMQCTEQGMKCIAK